jgi:hypothetical protein
MTLKRVMIASLALLGGLWIAGASACVQSVHPRKESGLPKKLATAAPSGLLWSFDTGG